MTKVLLVLLICSNKAFQYISTLQNVWLNKQVRRVTLVRVFVKIINLDRAELNECHVTTISFLHFKNGVKVLLTDEVHSFFADPLEARSYLLDGILELQVTP